MGVLGVHGTLGATLPFLSALVGDLLLTTVTLSSPIASHDLLPLGLPSSQRTWTCWFTSSTLSISPNMEGVLKDSCRALRRVGPLRIVPVSPPTLICQPSPQASTPTKGVGTFRYLPPVERCDGKILLITL